MVAVFVETNICALEQAIFVHEALHLRKGYILHKGSLQAQTVDDFTIYEADLFICLDSLSGLNSMCCHVAQIQAKYVIKANGKQISQTLCSGNFGGSL